MRKFNEKEYAAPKAEITSFECADVITVSADLKKSPTSATEGKTYVRVGQIEWQAGFKQ